jgi:hypothetical protein
MTLVPSGKAVEFPSYTNVLDYEHQLAFASERFRKLWVSLLAFCQAGPRPPAPADSTINVDS